MMTQNFRRTVLAASIATFALGLFALQAAENKGGELRLLCSNGIRAAVEKLKPEAEKTIGRKLSIEFSASTALKKEIDGGAAFDLTILTPGIIDDLAKSGKLMPGTETALASSDLGVGIKAGSPKADISTPEGMKRRLLAAKTLTWTDGGAAGPAVIAMFTGLGIEDQVKPKIILQKTPGRPAESVAEGENELMFAPISEIQTVKGVEVLGLFPKEYQKPVVMTAGVAAQTKDAEGALALVKFLTSSKAVPAMKSSGMTPASGK
jgi:molybdate transport system substrate-binding protein